MKLSNQEARKLRNHAKAMLEILDSNDEIPPGPWRDEPATNKQLAILDKHDVEYQEPITKGRASDLIDQVFSEIDLEDQEEPAE